MFQSVKSNVKASRIGPSRSEKCAFLNRIIVYLISDLRPSVRLKTAERDIPTEKHGGGSVMIWGAILRKSSGPMISLNA